MIGGVTFDPEVHSYRWAPTGQRFLSVTDVIKIEGFIRGDYFTLQSRERGRAVHLAIYLMEKGTLDWSSIDPIIEPYVAAYLLAKKEINWLTVYYEQKVCNPYLRYGGTLDLACVINGYPAVIDYKTGGLQNWTRYQTAGYADCLDVRDFCERAGIAMAPFKRFGLELRGDGKYDLKPFANPNDVRLFHSMVALAWEKINEGHFKWEELQHDK